MSNGRFLRMAMMMLAGAAMLGGGGAAASGQETAGQATAGPAAFGPKNPFYAPSTLPYQAPPFDKIKDSDYQPALEAGIAEQLKEIQAIAENPAPPTFDNTLVALEKSGQLFDRVQAVLDAVTQANSTPVLDKVQEIEAPKIAALQDAMFLNDKLFQRVATLYKQMDSLGLDADSRRLLDVYYKRFVHQGANLDRKSTRLNSSHLVISYAVF